MTVVMYELTQEEMSRVRSADDILGIVGALRREYSGLRDEAKLGGMQQELAHKVDACFRLELEIKRYREDVYKQARERVAKR